MHGTLPAIFLLSAIILANGGRPLGVDSLFSTDIPKYACSICQCQVKASNWALNPELAVRSELPREICLLCAERRDHAAIMASPQEALYAATLRYKPLIKQLGSEPQASWATTEQVVPSSWLPLIQKLKTLIGPPKVFQVIAPIILAVLA
ncbi:hypothetical protein ACG1BZ_05150 [Microbulbifer sp. CNSA002]|uniref:hypothetical protein n=1 Tax=unclassified Microbulbifer TaxID=2619833 RepID=UPI0039B545E6